MHTFATLTSILQSSLHFAYDHELLPRAMECDACRNLMEKVFEYHRLNGYRWHCGKR